MQQNVDFHESDKDFIEDINSLSQEEIDNIVEVSNALADKYDAEANMESQKKFRVLFERTASEHLPFVVYCIYVGFWGGISVFKLTNMSGSQLQIIAVLVALVMILPMFALPKKTLKSVQNKFKNIRSD